MQTPNMEQRLRLLVEKVHARYECLGHSARYPYVSFVYDPDDEKILPELLLKFFYEDEHLFFTIIDLLPLSIESVESGEEERDIALNDPMLAQNARHEIVQLWSDVLCEKIMADVAVTPVGKRPVAILYGLAAVHPLGTPTQLIELMAEMELHDERTGHAVPIVVFIPGYLPPQTHGYRFLNPESPLLPFSQGISM